jgi:ubiquinone/menaquinone biosynthesis C-methylase UbiE
MTIVKNIYRDWAKKYDQDAKFNPATAMDEKIILPLFNVKKDDVVLDIGCGTGRFTIPLAKKCKTIIGIDFSEHMLDVARKKGTGIKNIHFQKVDIRKKLPFKNETFDKVLCTLVFSHLENIAGILDEIHRVMKKEGILVYDDFAADLDLPIETMYDDLIEKSRLRGFDVFSYHSMNEHVNILHRLDFEILSIRLLRVDEQVQNTLSPDCYRRNKGRTLGIVFKIRK